ncbi:MAG: flagellar biosynthesis protein FlhA, partial [Spirochaetota bacterium]|nr:flagellar biosynthesis protein FlhA [Spirochaetota bacterium]
FKDPTMIFGAMIVIVVMMLIIPIPSFLLDFLMSVNLLFGILIVLIVSYTRKATDFSIFPTMLLVTTIMRVAVNVSSTRLILTEGANFDGKMVRAFGEFVVGGSNGAAGLVVGVIIFVILVLVQFIVITKGATRVAEVAARFSLNLFMAIDVEVNNGAITEEQAIEKRRQLSEESQFYGNMDGASKFIQGDVILGIIITLVNVIGGLIVGIVIHGEPFSEALTNYISLTVGDGLVGQIPSLLISFSTGLLVTRSSGNESSIGDTLWQQISRYDRVYMIAGIVLLVMSVLPGFPHFILIVMGALLIFFSNQLRSGEKKKQANIAMAEQESAAKKELGGTENYDSLLKVDELTLHIGYELIPLVNESDNSIISSIRTMRKHFAVEIGIIMPDIHIQDNIELEPNQYSFKLRGQEIGGGSIRPGCMMAMGSNDLEPIDGEETREPVFGLTAYWIREDARLDAEDLGYTVVDPTTIITTHIQNMVQTHADEILDRKATEELLKKLEKDNSAVVYDVKELGFKKGQIQKILQLLLREGVSIRDLAFILERLSDCSPAMKLYGIVEYIRQGMKRVICNKYKTDDNELFVLVVDHDIERLIEQSVRETEDGEPVVGLKPNALRAIQQAIANAVTHVQSEGYPALVVTNSRIRRAVWELCRTVNKSIAVISNEEVAGDLRFTIYGKIELPKKNDE